MPGPVTATAAFLTPLPPLPPATGNTRQCALGSHLNVSASASSHVGTASDVAEGWGQRGGPETCQTRPGECQDGRSCSIANYLHCRMLETQLPAERFTTKKSILASLSWRELPPMRRP